MNADAMRRRIKRLDALIAGFHRETATVLKNRGELMPDEWNRYVKAILDANGRLQDARMVLAIVVDRATAQDKGR
jgi:hypothetical protein